MKPTATEWIEHVPWPALAQHFRFQRIPMDKWLPHLTDPDNLEMLMRPIDPVGLIWVRRKEGNDANPGSSGQPAV